MNSIISGIQDFAKKNLFIKIGIGICLIFIVTYVIGYTSHFIVDLFK